MHPIWEILWNHMLLCALLGWFAAQALKLPLYYFVEGKWDWRRFFGSGGMPSSHSSMVVALAVMVGATQGFRTAAFAISVVFATIVMYDAAGVRRETGTQAAVINQILKGFLLEGKQISDEELKELVGHTPLEVLGGAVTGLLTAFAYLAVLTR